MKLTTLVKEEASPDVKKAIQTIRRHTQRNNVGDAILELATLLGNQIDAKIVKHINDIHKLQEYMPQHLLMYRTEVMNRLLEQAKKKYDPMTYKSLRASF